MNLSQPSGFYFFKKGIDTMKSALQIWPNNLPTKYFCVQCLAAYFFRFHRRFVYAILHVVLCYWFLKFFTISLINSNLPPSHRKLNGEAL